MHRGYLPAVRLAMELRPPHGVQEGRVVSAMRRLPPSERADIARRIPDTPHPRLRSWAVRLYNLLEDRHRKGVSSDTRASGRTCRRRRSRCLSDSSSSPGCPSAQTFQRLMDSVTAQLSGVFVYLDNVLVASASKVQHERDLWQLLDALRCFGLVLNVGKCLFSVRELEFLGHRVSGRGISPLPWKVKAVLGFERPHTVRSLQCLLGLVNFYRRFLPNIAATMRPLTDALAGAPRQLEWSEAMMSAFQQMKQRLAAATLLVHPVADAELRVNTDASSKAIDGAIHQVVQGQLQPLVFFIRLTSSA